MPGATVDVKFSENKLTNLLADDSVGVAETRSAFKKLMILYIIIVNVGVLKPM